MDVHDRYGWPDCLTPHYQVQEIVPAMIALRERFATDAGLARQKESLDALPSGRDDRRQRGINQRQEAAYKAACCAWLDVQPEKAEMDAQQAEAVRHINAGHVRQTCPQCGNVVWGFTVRHESELVARYDSKGYDDGGAWSEFRVVEGTPCRCQED